IDLALPDDGLDVIAKRVHRVDQIDHPVPSLREILASIGQVALGALELVEHLHDLGRGRTLLAHRLSTSSFLVSLMTGVPSDHCPSPIFTLISGRPSSLSNPIRTADGGDFVASSSALSNSQIASRLSR